MNLRKKEKIAKGCTAKVKEQNGEVQR